MILADYSQLFIFSLMGELNGRTDTPINLSLVRHLTLNVLLTYRKKYHKRFGELVICTDGDKYWRRELFDLYKYPRKKSKVDSGYDWQLIGDCMDQVQEELTEFFPYPVIATPRAEADDCIAIMADWSQTNDLTDGGMFDEPEPKSCLIVSSDTDFFQCHKHKNVKQVSPMLLAKDSAQVKSEVPLEQYILEHILTGDAGDGIPNVLVSQSFFKEKEDLSNPQRQKPVTANIKKFYLDQLNEHGKIITFAPIPIKDGTKIVGEISADHIRERFEFNRKLIDFNEIPTDVRRDVVLSYEAQTGKNRSKILDYFIKNRLSNLMESIDDF
jgi:hypothetical protein